MRHPIRPPDFNLLLEKIMKDRPQRFLEIVAPRSAASSQDYLHWDKLKYKRPPEGLTHEEWWIRTKYARLSSRRFLPLEDQDGSAFSFTLPDISLKLIEEINRSLSGQIGVSEEVTNPTTRDRYVVSSLIEEAIHSSQLEGASTTRKVAKDMIRSGRPPRDRDERMILNNYRAMQMIGELRDQRLTPDLICEIHRVVTEGTLINPDASGRFQLPNEERVGVYTEYDELLHEPPPAETLPERIEQLCKFANGDLDTTYVPPILRAITLHFMLAYEHPFEDGNGRTARAIFYWSMLNQGFWLAEFVAISPFLKKAPGKYRDSYLYTETDDNDLTYFHVYHLGILSRAITRLCEYLEEKMKEARRLRASLSTLSSTFNHRQIALLQHALKNLDAEFTAKSHGTSHRVAYETARQDLIALEVRGLLDRTKQGREYVWMPVVDLSERLQDSKVR